MKKTLFIILLISICFSSKTSAQMPDSIKACLDSALIQAKKFSLYRSTVSWEDVETQVFWRASLARTVLDLRQALSYLLERLDDSHGRFYFNNQPIAWFHGKPKPYQEHIDPKVWAVIQSGKYPFQFSMLPNKTGYLRIPGMPMGDNEQLAAPIRTAVCSLQALGAQQWIIDLRYNGGGNLFPMLAGIAPILGDAELGGAVDLNGNRYAAWETREGDVYFSSQLAVSMGNNCLDSIPPKVAVLTSRYTVSSGEAMAVVFKGREDTRFFGEHTGGFTTTTNLMKLPAGVTMSISTSYYVDRVGLVYKKFIPVDEEIIFNPDATSLEEDAAILRAVEWLGK